MRRLAFLSAILALTVVLHPAPAAPDRGAEDKVEEAPKPKDLILGKWTITQEKVNAVLEFQKDGTLVLTLSLGGDGNDMAIKAKYKFVEEKVFEVEFTAPGNQEKMTQKVTIVKITKDELVTKDDKGKEETFKRAKQ